jgi:DNA-directed RNA polymerase specialized sigma24 family protein/predicted Ser/Thr protein kinase
VERRHGIDINDHLDLIKIVAASMPGAKWLRSNDIWPQVQSEGWMAMHEALKNFEPSKGDPKKTLEQQFHTFASDYIREAIKAWRQQSEWYDPLESYDDVAARPMTPGFYKGVTARPPTPGDYMGVAGDLYEARELVQKLRVLLDRLPVGHSEVILQGLKGERGKEIAAEQGKSEPTIAKRRNLAKQKLIKGMRLARQTPMKPKTVAQADAQSGMQDGNLALQTQLEEGMSIAGYELEIEIGKGGHAEVWRAKKHVQKPAKEQLVAIKRLLPRWVGSEEAKRRFEREVRTASKLSHPNIVQFHDCLSDSGALLLVMEYIDGRNLAQLVEERPLSRDAAVYLVEQVLAGLGHAHDRGIVHRDIKPSNILISREGAVKVSDFGIAQAAVTHLTLARKGETMGTSEWMSPEQKARAPVDERSDLYVVGLLFEALLFGRLDDELSAFATRLRAHLPKDRFQSAGEALEALPKCDHRQATRELMAHVRGEAIPAGETRPGTTSLAPPSTAAVTTPRAMPAVSPTTSRWRTAAIALAAALLLLAGAGGVLVGQLWTDEAERQSLVAEPVSEAPPAMEAASEPAPAVVPAQESVPTVGPVPEPPSVALARGQAPGPESAKQGQPRATKKRRRPFLTSPLPDNPFAEYLPD